MQRQSILRRFRRAVAALALVAAAAGSAVAGQDSPPAGLRPAPEFLDLFAPRLHRNAYRALVSPLPLDQLLQRLARDPQLQHPTGSWTAAASAPTDAFGDAGSYHRFRLIRLYGSQRARVARGPRISEDDGALESWTLVSPYPDPSLTRLEPGTLVLVVRVPER